MSRQRVMKEGVRGERENEAIFTEVIISVLH